MFSFPNVSAKYFRLSAHHSSKRPSSSIRFMSSCVPDTLMRIARTWLLPILRVSPASSNLRCIAAERSFTPSGYSMSLRFRCVRVGSAFFGMMKGLEWGELYEKYHAVSYNQVAIRKRVSELYADECVTRKRGIFEYVLGGEQNPVLLEIRLFEKSHIKTLYERQTQQATADGTSNCPMCSQMENNNRNRIYKLAEMDADHVSAWSKGGKTDISNCQLLCKTHNRMKGNK